MQTKSVTGVSCQELVFSTIKKEVEQQFNRMQEHELFRVQVDKDLLWETYLSSFPEGTNPMYKERTEHDCNCCKGFIRNCGNMVAIMDGQVVSIWDITIDSAYQVVVNAMSALVKSCVIENKFLHCESVIGTDKNYQLLESGETKTWNHFYIKLPSSLIMKGELIGTELSNFRSTKDVMLRSLNEITFESIDTVLDLIAQNSLYRGEEHTFAINSFKQLKTTFDKLSGNTEKDIFCWSKLKSTATSVSKIRNTVIGTLLVDISEGKDLEDSVKSFESKVAPTNYKRPTALITKAMIEKAKKEIDDLGLTSALERRFAVLEDITINNILFANRKAKKRMNNVFDELSSKASDNIKNLDKVEEVNIDQFISKILPNADSIEIMFDNKHTNNLVSLIAPVDLTARNMFKWDNNFSWSYTGDLTDSIKERVKLQGGRVEGDLRCSLAWFNYDDLDLHLIEPKGYEIQYTNKGRLSPNGGFLDVDMNAGSGSTRNAVENIVYPDKKTMKDGIYKLIVHNYNKRESIDVGFDIEIEFDGITYTFNYPKAVGNNERIVVAHIDYSQADGFEIVESLPHSQTVKELWNISTNSFQKVSVMMLSPNHWNDKVVGNKHYFFMLENCVNDGTARGFYNEFLKEELNVHRKVLEIVGSRMKTEKTVNQLSGLGFSSTQRNALLCRVKGSFNRIIKILF